MSSNGPRPPRLLVLLAWLLLGGDQGRRLVRADLEESFVRDLERRIPLRRAPARRGVGGTMSRTRCRLRLHDESAGQRLHRNRRSRPLDTDARLGGHYRLDAVRAHLLERAGDRERAILYYRAAAKRTASAPERDYLMLRAARLAASPSGRDLAHEE